MKYEVTGSRDFVDAEGYPAITPPWGTLNAIDLNTGRYLWKIPLGEYPELAAKGMTQHGLGKLWRPDRHRRKSPLHRCDGARQEIQSIRQQEREAALGNGIALCGHGNAGDLHDRRQAVCSDCKRRDAIHQRTHGQRVHCLFATVAVLIAAYGVYSGSG